MKQTGRDALVQSVYYRIINLAFMVHVTYVLIFVLLSCPGLWLYNLVSSLFYLAMLYVAKRACFRLIVTFVHLEVCLFVVVYTLMGGWETGVPTYLVAIASLVYFCPFDHKIIPYLFSVGEILLFGLLRLYTLSREPFYPFLSGVTWLYLYNVTLCFAIILFAAFLSNVSAAVTKKELQDENRSLSALANYDQLTGLMSRYFFLSRLEESRDEPFLLAMGDIDDFKSVNDMYGHNCGDYILRSVAELMSGFCNTYCKSESGMQAVRVDLCRWGGEEMLLLIRSDNVARIEQGIDKLRQAVADYPFHFEGRTLHVTITFGLCVGSPDRPVTELIEEADKRLYIGKKKGKNCVVGVMGSTS